MSRPRVLVIGARDSSFAGSGPLGVDVDLVQSTERLTPTQERKAGRVRIVDLEDVEATCAVAEAMHREAPFAGVAAFHEHLLLTACAVAERLGVRGTSRAAIETSLDKARTRDVAGTGGFAQPEHVVVRHVTGLASAVDRIGLPVVVKPLDGAGSRGVHPLREQRQLDALIADLPPRSGPWLVEALVEGPEYSAETFTRDGRTALRGITRKLTDADTLVELGHETPATLTGTEHETIAAATSSLMNSIGLDLGPGHTEFKLVDGKPFLIETHTRYGGDRIWEMTGLTTGHYPQAEMLAAVGAVPFVATPAVADAAAVRFLTLPAGRVTAVEGSEEAARAPAVARYSLDLRVGDLLAPLASSDDRHGFVLTTSATPSAAGAHADAALAAVHVDLHAG